MSKQVVSGAKTIIPDTTWQNSSRSDRIRIHNIGNDDIDSDYLPMLFGIHLDILCIRMKSSLTWYYNFNRV